MIAGNLIDNFWTDNGRSKLECELEKKHDQRKSPYDLAKQLLIK